MILESRALKVTAVLDPAAIAGITVPNGTAKFAVKLRVAGRTLSADLNAKSLRRCVIAVQAAEEGGVAVVLQGRLEGDAIVDAGITAQPRPPKPTAA
jgi:hypothetical protein